MPYVYAEQRANLFTEEGQRMFLKVRDAAKKLIGQAGVVRVDKLMGHAGTGDSWDMLACADRMVELGELHEIPNTISSAGQHRLFTTFDQ